MFEAGFQTAHKNDVSGQHQQSVPGLERLATNELALPGPGREENLYHSDWVTILGLLRTCTARPMGCRRAPLLAPPLRPKTTQACSRIPILAGHQWIFRTLVATAERPFQLFLNGMHTISKHSGCCVSGSAEDDSTQPALHVPGSVRSSGDPFVRCGGMDSSQQYDATGLARTHRRPKHVSWTTDDSGRPHK